MIPSTDQVTGIRFSQSICQIQLFTQEGYEQVSDGKFYNPITQPIVFKTATKIKTIVYTLFSKGHIYDMTYKWLNSGQNLPKIPDYFRQQ